MYTPSHFAQTHAESLHRLMREHPLGMLVTAGPDGLDADHLPFEFDPGPAPLGRLQAHVARANPLWQRCPSGTPVMVVFRGAQAYVSPSWYPSKHEAHRQVPTWNYEVVHVHGRLVLRDDERFLRGLLARLTRQHEAAEARPWKMGDSAPEFIAEMLARIVGIEVEITAITGKSKLSQNKEPRDRLQAAEVLAARGQGELAQAMRDAGAAGA
ncbi:MAG: FMN-binding negative transcriptional regulator [Burkholderiaceae bacterium]|nr:FMN-binding negative transcriptional regulator [Burkholderiaceae bacterium]